ncbi:MFS transporter [Rothia sp. ZJ1223]|uniref:MFS transporter n=1 Tax=Rothia sp. ZJ1223 TaxID=2811098 RepID=UPI001958BDDD|nr:MFS transporter [Rothia sp. ZJ1223]
MNQLARYSPGSAEYRRLLIAMFCAGLATFAQLYAPQSVLPAIAAGINVSVDTAVLTISAATAGLALSALGWAWLADRFGRARIMLWALPCATVLGLLSPHLKPYSLLLVVRFIEGCFLAGVAAVAVSYIVSITTVTARSAAAGIFISGTSLGGLAGRLVSGFVAQFFSWQAALTSVSVLAMAATLTFYLLLPRVQEHPRNASAHASQFMRQHLRNPVLMGLYLAVFLLMGAFVSIYNYLTFRLEAQPFALPVALVSLLFCAYLLGTFSSTYATSLVKKYRFGQVFGTAVGLTVLGILLTLSSSLVVIIAGLATLTTGFFAAHALASAQVGIIAATGRTQATALYNVFYYAGSAVVGWLMGLLYVQAGWLAVALACAACVLAAGLLVANTWRPPTKNPAPPATPTS